ncbi:MAG: DUF5522 domain-containing protein [Chitinophagaceae bacterium]
MKELIENIDYYINEDGYVVLTEKYHLDKGFCCGNGCLHCPFQYESVPEPRRSELKSLSEKKTAEIQRRRK